jgi:hypothetical protein
VKGALSLFDGLEIQHAGKKSQVFPVSVVAVGENLHGQKVFR